MEVFNKIDWLLKIFEQVKEETKEKVTTVEFQTWIDFYSYWIDLWKWLNQSLGDEWAKSLLLWRATELNKHLLWLSFSAWVGSYHCVIRESRYIFESILQAYYIDKNYPFFSMQEKFEKLKEQISVGRLTKVLPYNEELYEIYQDLCKYVHPSSEEIEPVIKAGKVEPNILFTFDEELFDKCVNFTSEVMDIFFLILLNFHPLIEQKIKEDKLMIEMIESFPSQLSLRYLNRDKKCL